LLGPALPAVLAVLGRLDKVIPGRNRLDALPVRDAQRQNGRYFPRYAA
jgi:hypothetical protein